MQLKTESKIFLSIILGSIILAVIAVFMLSQPEKTIKVKDLIPQDAHTLGDKSAKVYLVEFSDLQCPACKAFKPSVDYLTQKYPDKFLFVYRHFPLPVHQYAFKAAHAAEAAGQQGKFWESINFLFDNQEKFSEQFIIESGKALGLDEQKFKKALEDEKFKEKISQDISDGSKLGIQGTPTFFLNGQKLTPNSAQDLITLVEKKINQNY